MASNMVKTAQDWMRQAIHLAVENVRTSHGGPFGAVVVKDGVMVAAAANSVTANNDPTAHAEVVAIRDACRELGTFQLSGCELYTSCEPCPMCLGAIYWARLEKYFFACTRADAMACGFDDAFIYDELVTDPEKRAVAGYSLLREEGLAAFECWTRDQTRVRY